MSSKVLEIANAAVLRKRILAPGKGTLDKIRRATADAFDLTEQHLTGPDRTARVSNARFIAMYLGVRAGYSTNEVGSAFNRTRSLVLHGIGFVRDQMDVDARFKTLIERMENELLS